MNRARSIGGEMRDAPMLKKARKQQRAPVLDEMSAVEHENTGPFLTSDPDRGGAPLLDGAGLRIT